MNVRSDIRGDAVIFNDRINLETCMNNIIICPLSWRTFGLTGSMSVVTSNVGSSPEIILMINRHQTSFLSYIYIHCYKTRIKSQLFLLEPDFLCRFICSFILVLTSVCDAVPEPAQSGGGELVQGVPPHLVPLAPDIEDHRT